MVLTIDEIFDKVQDRWAKRDSNSTRPQYIYKVVITGSSTRTFTLDYKQAKLYEGDDENADCCLTCDLETFLSMASGALDPKSAVAQKKLTIDGDISVALELLPFVKMAIKDI